jgi:hypothetical protein
MSNEVANVKIFGLVQELALNVWKIVKKKNIRQLLKGLVMKKKMWLLRLVPKSGILIVAFLLASLTFGFSPVHASSGWVGVNKLDSNYGEFSSVEELDSWCKVHIITIFSVGNHQADCDDYAMRLQREAYKDGYFVSCQLIENGSLYGVNVSDYKNNHMGNLAIVKNNIYYIEPLPKQYKITYVCHRD